MIAYTHGAILNIRLDQEVLPTRAGQVAYHRAVSSFSLLRSRLGDRESHGTQCPMANGGVDPGDEAQARHAGLGHGMWESGKLNLSRQGVQSAGLGDRPLDH